MHVKITRKYTSSPNCIKSLIDSEWLAKPSNITLFFFETSAPSLNCKKNRGNPNLIYVIA